MQVTVFAGDYQGRHCASLSAAVTRCRVMIHDMIEQAL